VLRARLGRRRTSADIVFEYLSKATAAYDRTTKADTYLALGVRELWLVDPEAALVEVRNAVVGTREGEPPKWEVRRFGRGEWAESQVLSGWRMAVDELLSGLA
jgi:Uma2 family endonuclease